MAGRTRGEIADDMVDEIIAHIRKRFGFIEDAEGGPLLRIIFTDLDTDTRLETVLVGAATTATPNARHLTVVGGAR